MFSLWRFTVAGAIKSWAALSIAVVLRRQAGKAQSGHPPLGTLLQMLDRRAGKSLAGRLFEKGLGLGQFKHQVPHPNFDQIVVGAQRFEQKRRIPARNNDQVHRLGWMLQQNIYQFVNARLVDVVVVIQDQHKGSFEGFEIVAQNSCNLR